MKSADTATGRVIITGGARGIGAAAARGFIEAGFKVATLDLRDPSDILLDASLESWRHYHCDVSSANSVNTVFDAAAAWMGGLDTLINVAGLDKPGTAEDVTEAEWDLVMAVNAKGAMLTNKAALQHMRQSGGRIINFTSIYGVRGSAERAAYSAAKAAVIGWTRAAARDWGRFCIAVNAIAPIMATEVAEKFLSGMPSDRRLEMEATLAREIPLTGGMGEPARDLVPLLLFLSGPGAGYITGQVLPVDGGMMIG